MTRLLTAISIALLIGGSYGCGESASPTSPAGPPAPNPLPNFTLSGLVFADTPTGPLPIAGVVVAERLSGRRTTSGEDGRYSLERLLAPANNVISASGWGLQPFTTTVAMSADTQLDIKVVQLPSYTISGVVFERTPAGTAPIQGVQLYCDSCGSPDGHTFAYTDADGNYAFAYAYPGGHLLLIAKDGYGDPPGQPAGPINNYLSRNAIVSGDTRLDIELVRR